MPTDARKIQVLDKMKFSELRKEFQSSINDFQTAVSARAAPKRIGGVILNGEGYLKLIDEILHSFNSNNIPQVKGAVERLIEQTRKDAWEIFKGKTDKAVEESEGGDALLILQNLKGLFNQIYQYGIKRHEKEIIIDIFNKCVPYFFAKLEEQRKSPNPKYLKAVEASIESVFEGDADGLYTRLKQVFLDNKLIEKQLPVAFVQRMLNKGSRFLGDSVHQTIKSLEAESSELVKDAENIKLMRKQAEENSSRQKEMFDNLKQQHAKAETEYFEKLKNITELKKI